jgi:hypothetical protein
MKAMLLVVAAVVSAGCAQMVDNLFPDTTPVQVNGPYYESAPPTAPTPTSPELARANRIVEINNLLQGRQPPRWWCTEDAEAVSCRVRLGMPTADLDAAVSAAAKEKFLRVARMAQGRGMPTYEYRHEALPGDEIYGELVYVVYRATITGPGQLVPSIVLDGEHPLDDAAAAEARDYLALTAERARLREERDASPAPAGYYGGGGPVCTTGCPCGNTCISCSYTCHVGAGSARSGAPRSRGRRR